MGSTIATTTPDPCPICGKACHNVAYHVFMNHLRSMGHGASGTPYVGCFCDWEDYAQTDHGFHLFLKHLDEKGGLEAHLLEVKLGVVP